MFDKMKQLIDMQKKMQEIKHELENASFEISSPDGLIKIIMNGSQEVKAVNIQGDISSVEKVNLEEIIRDTYNRAIKHSHVIAAQKMKDATGFNLSGLI